MKEEILRRLENDLDVDFKKDDGDILSEYYDYYISIASSYSNCLKDDERLIPFVYFAIKSAYIRRGDEGMASSNEGGLSYSYLDIEEKLKKDVLAIRKANF